MKGTHVLAAAGLLLGFAGHAAVAQQKTLVVAGYGGSWEQTLRKAMFPDFEAKHGVKIEYTAGNSTDTLAKLQAQKANQVIDVAIVDAAASSPFAQLSMVPLLTLTAYYAPHGHRATWFALMASLMNLALVAGQLQTKYLNQIFTVGRGDYSELGALLLIAAGLGLVIPLAAIVLFGRRV